MEDYYEYLDSNGVTTLYKLIKDDTVALIDSYSVTINGITTTLDTHINNSDIHTPISDIESMVDTKIAGLVNSAPETLDTLKELSDALGNDPNFATTVANQIGNKASKDSVYTKEETDTLLEGKANSKHSHVVSDITDFPTIPTKVSELSNDSNFVTSTELHDYATKNDLNSKQDALSEEQLSNIDSIPDKANKSDLSTVATSGSYKDLLDKPVIPEGADLSDYYNKGETDNLLNSKANTSDLAVVAKSGNYNDLNNTPTIPTKLSQLENDMGFGTGGGSGDASDCVHKTGDETIAGVKTFTASPFVSNYAVTNGFFTKLNTIARNEVPSQIYHSAFRVFDKNAKTLGEYCVEKSTTGCTLLNMNVRSEDSNGKQLSESLYLNMSNDGSAVRFYPSSNNKVDLGMSNHKWANVYSTNDITNKVITYSVTNHNDTSSMTVCGGSAWDKGSTLFLYSNSHSNYPGAFNLTAKNTTNESKLVGFPDGRLQWDGKNVALDENLVHRSGEEYISGVKHFYNAIYSYQGVNFLNDAMDINTTPTSTIHSNIYFKDKNYKTISYIQYAHNPNGIHALGCFLQDSANKLYGVAVNSAKEFYPFGDNTYSLGKSNIRWANVFATTLNGNLKGTIDTSTTATTQATTDNSTRIATTAWVRNYVNSVAGSGSVGASISAYYSNATTLTAEGNSSSSTGPYPADYSNYIDIAPTVGTIYTGSQLFGTLNASASGSTYSYSPSGSTVYQTTAKATATFSGAFSASAKYLCTTANAVRFRAYVSQGTSSSMGSPSVVDNSSTKSIFIRVE